MDIDVTRRFFLPLINLFINKGFVPTSPAVLIMRNVCLNPTFLVHPFVHIVYNKARPLNIFFGLYRMVFFYDKNTWSYLNCIALVVVYGPAITFTVVGFPNNFLMDSIFSIPSIYNIICQFCTTYSQYVPRNFTSAISSQSGLTSNSCHTNSAKFF